MLALVEKNNLDLVCQLDNNLPRVMFDHDKIIQVLTNLVNNALKFTEKGGVIISTSIGDNFIQVGVKDSGIGIKEENIEKLFQEFTQLQRKVGGTGLGLSICKKIIEALLFVSDKPVSIDTLREVIEEVEPSDIRTIMEELNNDYASSGRTFSSEASSTYSTWCSSRCSRISGFMRSWCGAACRRRRR